MRTGGFVVKSTRANTSKHTYRSAAFSSFDESFNFPIRSSCPPPVYTFIFRLHYIGIGRRHSIQSGIKTFHWSIARRHFEYNFALTHGFNWWTNHALDWTMAFIDGPSWVLGLSKLSPAPFGSKFLAMRLSRKKLSRLSDYKSALESPRVLRVHESLAQTRARVQLNPQQLLSSSSFGPGFTPTANAFFRRRDHNFLFFSRSFSKNKSVILNWNKNK